MVTIFLFVAGIVVGSFLNVVALRWDLPSRGGALSNLGGRSSCPSCGKTLGMFELVPIVSFLILRAKCRECKSKISWQYPIVEICTGLVFVSLFYVVNPVNLISLTHYLFLIIIFCIYIVITIYDFRHKIIPDELVYTAIFLSFLTSLFFVEYSLLDWLSGPILFTLFASIWFFSRGRAMGFGDAKLGLSVGLLLGATEGFSAIVLSFWIGAIGSLVYIFLNKMGFIKGDKKLTIKSEVPFGPAIILGTWLVMVFHLNIFNVVSL